MFYTTPRLGYQVDEELAVGIDLGPLHGIPVAVKDIIAAHEGPTTAQSQVLDPAWGAGKDARGAPAASSTPPVSIL